MAGLDRSVSAKYLAQLRESVGNLMGVVGQVASAGTPAQRTAAVEKLDALRRELYGLLAE